MKSKNIFLFVLLASFIFAINLAAAQPPFNPYVPPSGYYLDAAPLENPAINQNISFDFHVYNSTDGNLINDSSLVCQLHVYDDQGYHTFTADLTWSAEGDYFAVAPNGTFSELGYYHMMASCVHPVSGAGGNFPAGSFYITPEGHAPITGFSFFGSWILFLGVLFSLIFLFLYALGGMLSLRFDLMDVSLNIGAFFVLFGFKFFASDYLGVQLMNDVLGMAFDISVWTNIVIPLVGFFFTLLLGPYLLKKYPNIGGRMPGYKEPWEYKGGEKI